MSTFIDHQLGQRRLQGVGFVPGFIREYAPLITKCSLLGPVVLEGLSLCINHRKELAQCPYKAKELIIKHLMPLPQETAEEARTRILGNLGKVALCCLGITAAAVAVYATVHFGLLPASYEILIHSLRKVAFFKHAMTWWNSQSVWNSPIPETPGLVYSGYTAIGSLHAYRAKQSWDKGEKIQTMKHLFASLASGLSIAHMLTDDKKPRWHHMSYGLLAMVPQLRALNLFGSCMVVDSMLYWLRPLKDQYDFSNIFIERAGSFLVQISALSLIEIARNRLSQKTEAAPISKAGAVASV